MIAEYGVAGAALVTTLSIVTLFVKSSTKQGERNEKSNKRHDERMAETNDSHSRSMQSVNDKHQESVKRLIDDERIERKEARAAHSRDIKSISETFEKWNANI